MMMNKRMNNLGLCWLVLLLALAGCVADDSECRVKQEVCYEGVKVNVSTFIEGLIDDVPKEAIVAFVEASAECLQCVDLSDLLPLGSGNNGCPSWQCSKCGDEWKETWLTCRDCCGYCRCMGCDPDKHWGMCEDCCDDRRLSKGDDSVRKRSSDFTVDVCMDDIKPKDPTATYYVDYEDMIDDFEKELKACYSDKDNFKSMWSAVLAAAGLDLSSLARDGDTTNIMFDMEGIDKEGAQVKTYSSDESHRSTSNMFFYSALGFVAISVFAVVGTAIVVRVFNKRNEQRAEQAARWVSEMASEGVVNPVGEGDKSASSL